MKKIFSLLFVLLLYGCITYDPPRGGIKIHNYTDSAIYIYKTCVDSFLLTPELKLFYESPGNKIDERGNKIPPITSPYYRINAFSIKGFRTGGTPEKPSLSCKNKTIYFFIIKESTMRAKTWEEIVKNQLYDAKIVKTEDELNKEGWEILYDPNSLVTR